MNGELLAYWEQGWEGQIAFAFSPENSHEIIFLENGHFLMIYGVDGEVLWSGTIKLVSRRFWDNHQLSAGIWSNTKQKGVSYAQWMAWFWEKPPLKASLKIEKMQ